MLKQKDERILHSAINRDKTAWFALFKGRSNVFSCSRSVLGKHAYAVIQRLGDCRVPMESRDQ